MYARRLGDNCARIPGRGESGQGPMSIAALEKEFVQYCMTP